MLLLACASRLGAEPCDSFSLPAEIKSALQKEFADWKIVTPELLSSPDDRQIWNDCCRNECPGLITGHFTGQGVEYAANLVKGSGEKLQQQIVLFKPASGTFRKVIVDRPSHVARVSVLSKLPPGEYRSAETDRTVKLRFDAIGSEALEAGAGVFYWDGKRFRFLITSV